MISSHHPHVDLYDSLSDQAIRFALDSGAACTLASSGAVSRFGLRVFPPDSSIPLLSSADNSPLPAIGFVRMHLHVPRSDQSLAVTVVVVESLFTDFLLGRNVIEACRQLYGADGLWSAGAPVPMSSIATVASEHLQDEFKCSLLDDVVMPPGGQLGATSRIDVTSTACCWVAESALIHGAVHLDRLQGMFLPDAQLNSAQAFAASAVVTATVDWTDAGKRESLRRVLLPVSLVVVCLQQAGACLLRAGTRVGHFFIGAPAMTATVSATTELDLLESVCAATKLSSPFLTSSSDRTLADQVLRKFQFVEDLQEAGRAIADPLVIELVPSAQPVAKRNYPLTSEEEAFAEEQILKWLQAGTIQPSQSPWSSPIVVAHHPRTGKARMCIDYRGLNALTVADRYPMPLIHDISRAIKDCLVFSKIDLAQGFNQFPVSVESRPLTAFRGPRSGKYEYVGSPFGLRNLPSAFQRLMDLVLGTMLWKHAACYIDDIIVFSASVSEHHSHLEQLADRLSQFNLAVRASKCSFYVAEVDYLGFIFDGKTACIDPERLRPILELEAPTTREATRRFLGLMGQFRHLIFDYAHIADPLEQIKHKLSKAPFDCSPGTPAHGAFLHLRQELLRIPQLHIPDMRLPFRCYVDASGVTMSLVLAQVVDGEERLIAFYSKAFTAEQRRWAAPLQECHALHYFALNKVWPYLACGGPHEVLVDNLSVAALTKDTLSDKKLQRIAVDLQTLNLKLIKIPGTKNLADAPTRPPFVKADPIIDAALKEFVSPLRDNPGWQAIRKLDEQQPAALVAPSLSPSPAVAAVLTPTSSPSSSPEESSYLLPPVEELVRLQRADPELFNIIQFVEANRPSPTTGASQDERKQHLHLSRAASGCILTESNLLVFFSGTCDVDMDGRVAVPSMLRGTLLDRAHAGPHPHTHLGRHAGAMEADLGRSVWWPGLHRACVDYECATCCRQKKSHLQTAGLLHSTIVSRPGEVVSLDLVPMPTVSGHVGFALMVDRFSGALVAVPLTKKTSVEAIRAWDSSMGTWLLDVQTLQVDQDPALLSSEFKAAMKERGITVRAAFAAHQQANFVERSVQHVKQALRTTLDGLPTSLWLKALPGVVQCINKTDHSSKGASPFEILTGWAPRGYVHHTITQAEAVLGKVLDSRESLWERVQGKLEDAALAQASIYNRRHADRRFVTGDIVLIKLNRQEVEDGNFNLSPPYDPNPRVVLHVLSEVTVLLGDCERDGKRFTAHVDSIKLAMAEFDPRTNSADGEPQYVVQKIHKHRRNKGQVQYLVEWGGYRDSRSYTWEPAAGLEAGAADILQRYNALAGVVQTVS